METIKASNKETAKGGSEEKDGEPAEKKMGTVRTWLREEGEAKPAVKTAKPIQATDDDLFSEFVKGGMTCEEAVAAVIRIEQRFCEGLSAGLKDKEKSDAEEVAKQ